MNLEELNTLAEKLVIEIRASLKRIQEVDRKEEFLKREELRLREIEKQGLKAKSDAEAIQETVKREKMYISKINSELSKKAEEQEKEKAKLQELAEANELKLKEIATKQKALEERISEYRDLEAKTKDIEYRESLIAQEKAIARERTTMLDIREQQLDAEKERIARFNRA